MNIGKIKRIYKPFAMNELKKTLAYRGGVYLHIISKLIGVFLQYYLWMAVYKNLNTTNMYGFSKCEMIVYVFMLFVTSETIFIELSAEIGDNVTKGSIYTYLIKPISYRSSLISMGVGAAIYRFLFPCVFVWLGIEIYKVFALKMGVMSIINLLLYLISCTFSFLIYEFFEFCFGMIAFYTTYIFGLFIIKDAIIAFLSGKLIPIDFFPKAIEWFLKLSPFSSMVYEPCMIYMGKYQVIQLLMVLGKQFCWVLIMHFISKYIWKKVTKRMVVLGG